jgi:hypothetical protein
MTTRKSWIRATGLLVAAALAGILPAAVGAAQESSPATGAAVSVQEVDGDLQGAIEAAGREGELVWVAYRAPALHPDGGMCCDHHDAGGDLCGVCRLTARSALTHTHTDATDGTVELDATPEITVLARFEQGRLTRLRTLSPGCRIDPSGSRVVWLEGVAPTASLEWLASVVDERSGAASGAAAEDRVLEGAVGAVAQHAAPDAYHRLERWSATGAPSALREQAVFWMGAARRPEAWPRLGALLQDEPDEGVRERAVFAAYLSRDPRAIDGLVRVAHDDSSRAIRGSALMWLAQLAGERAAAAITTAVDDPDVEIRKSAVFALSQLPPERGVPLLIRIATTHAHPEVRRQAIFWLGQSGDERALALIEDLLTGD